MSQWGSNGGVVVVPLIILFWGFRVSQILIGERERERERELGKKQINKFLFLINWKEGFLVF